MDKKIIEEKLKEIQEAIKDLEEPLKTMAVEKWLGHIFNEGNKTVFPSVKKVKITNKNRRKTSQRNESIDKDNEKDKKMMENLNKTQHPEIHVLEKSLDKSLYVLKMMKDKGYDGLNPSQILKILTEVFRIKAKLPAISMALINDKYYTISREVNYKGTKANEYKIMKSGEDYLKKKLKELTAKGKKDVDENQEEGAPKS